MFETSLVRSFADAGLHPMSLTLNFFPAALDGTTGPSRIDAARQFPPPASLILVSASSTVNVFGFCTAGNSLNVSANFPATACTA